jgi:hypothetical protein
VAALPRIRSRPGLEQMVTRAAPNAEATRHRAFVFRPDKPLFGLFRRRMETGQGTTARRPKPRDG